MSHGRMTQADLMADWRRANPWIFESINSHKGQREMTREDLGLHKMRAAYSMDQLCLWWDHVLGKRDPSYTFWLGADA